jgi:deoxyribodipyrimidine photo-lyase
MSTPPGGFVVPNPDDIAGRPVWLVHPWSLADPPAGLPAGSVKVGIVLADWHAVWPWNERRWRFVAGRMDQLCDLLWCGDGTELQAALAGAPQVQGIDTAHLGAWPGRRWLAPSTRLFDDPGRRCASFSQFWTRVTKRMVDAAELLSE